MYELSTFDNGLRLVTVTMPNAYSSSIGFYLAVGSRHESDAEAGASHFVEHMLFKGTHRRPTPREIALAVEGLGGGLNASTGRESTNYYARVSRDDLPVAADVLSDMLLNSRFLPTDVEREAQVIVEEISESLDAPDDLVFIEAQKLLWPDHPLGRDVAGTKESVRGLSREALQDYMARGYAPQSTVVAVAGPQSHGQVREVVEPFLGDWQGSPTLTMLPSHTRVGPKVRIVRHPVEQSHVVLTLRAYDRHHPDRYVLGLLNNLLGEGMSSRLFVSIREERGLAYSVYSYASALQDSGAFAVYAAVDREQTRATLQAILDELRRLRDEVVSAEELQIAKNFVRGSLLLGLEHSSANAGWVGNRLILSNHIPTPEEVVASFNTVTAEDIQRVAQDLFRNEELLLSVVGPEDEDGNWEGLLQVE